MSRADQEYQLGGYPGLVSEAIAAQLDVGEPGGAVEVAELGRGILLSAALDTRTDVTELDENAPELAARFRSLRDALNAIGLDAPEDTNAARRRELSAQWDHLLKRIRHQPGLEHFLDAPHLACSLLPNRYTCRPNVVRDRTRCAITATNAASHTGLGTSSVDPWPMARKPLGKPLIVCPWVMPSAFTGPVFTENVDFTSATFARGAPRGIEKFVSRSPGHRAAANTSTDADDTGSKGPNPTNR